MTENGQQNFAAYPTNMGKLLAQRTKAARAGDEVMTDEELGKKLIYGWDSLPTMKRDYEHFGARARTILAAERPQVMREVVDDYAKKQVMPFGDVDAHWKSAAEVAWRALLHFAPARETRPIDGMSVKETIDHVEKHLCDVLCLAYPDMIGEKVRFAVQCAVSELHHLAQPVPKVDPDAAEACGRCQFWKQTSVGDQYNKPRGHCRAKPPIVTAPNEGFREWPVTENSDWCGEWRAVAAAKKGDEA